MSETLLKDRVEFQYGFSVRVNDEKSGEYPVFGSNGITGYIDSYKVESPGVIIGRKGSVGAIKFSNENFTPTDTAYYLSIKDKTKDDIKFWYYYLQLLGLEKLNTHSSVPGLSREIAYFVNVNPPNISAQKKIAAVLSALDAKIELNQRINAELETMAKTLYDYWFVQFEYPTPSAFGTSPKFDGTSVEFGGGRVGVGYKSAGGKMVWNEELKREIPLGWEVKKFGEIASIIAGGDKPKVFSVEKTDTCSAPIYSNGISDEGLYGYTDKAKITERSITVSARGTIGYCVLRTKPFVPIIRLIVITPHISFSTKYFEEYFKSFEFEKSGSVQQQLTVPQVSNIDILYPPIDILKRYDEVTSPLISQIEILKEESLQLAKLRDWLLPMLMNGQVTVG